MVKTYSSSRCYISLKISKSSCWFLRVINIEVNADNLTSRCITYKLWERCLVLWAHLMRRSLNYFKSYFYKTGNLPVLQIFVLVSYSPKVYLKLATLTPAIYGSIMHSSLSAQIFIWFCVILTPFDWVLSINCCFQFQSTEPQLLFMIQTFNCYLLTEYLLCSQALIGCSSITSYCHVFLSRWCWK